MKTNISNSLISIALSIALFNCKGSQGDPGPTGSAGPASSGAINGVVILTTSNGTQPIDMSGVTVKTNKGDSVVTTTSGAWTLNEITGIYTITFTKAGYGTTTIYGYNFAGGGSSYINNTALSQAPGFTANMTLDTLGGSSSPTKDLHMNANLAITGGVTGLASDKEFFVYYSTSSAVSSSNYMGMTNVSVPAAQVSYNVSITGSAFLTAGIESGQVVYLVVYPSATTTALSSKYVNETTGKTVYTSLGHASTVQSLTVPH